MFWLILHSVPWSALKCHQGEDWPSPGRGHDYKEAEAREKERARRDFSECCRSMGWSLRASHALCVAFPKVIWCRRVVWVERHGLKQPWCEQDSCGCAPPPANQQRRLSDEKKKPHLIREIVMITLQWYLGLGCGVSFTKRLRSTAR